MHKESSSNMPFDKNKKYSNRVYQLMDIYSFITNNVMDYSTIVDYRIETLTNNIFLLMDEMRYILSLDPSKFMNVSNLSRNVFSTKYMYEWVIDDDGFMIDIDDKIILELIDLSIQISKVYDEMISNNNGTVIGNAVRIRFYIQQIDYVITMITE